MICPWIYEKDKIILEYPPTHQGLLDWMIQKNITNLVEREQTVTSFPHKDRVNYVKRCMESTFCNKIEQIATSTFRRQSTDSKETYENNQKLGIPHGHDNQNEDNIDFSSYSVVRNTDDVIDIISNLRYEHGEDTTAKKAENMARNIFSLNCYEEIFENKKIHNHCVNHNFASNVRDNNLNELIHQYQHLIEYQVLYILLNVDIDV